jgi:hypothetical protein
MFLVKMFIPWIPFLPNRAATMMSDKQAALIAGLTSMITMKVLFQRFTLDSSESVGGESTG